MTSGWTARYPDLTGKAVVVTGDSRIVNEVVRSLAANAALLAIVAADREIVDEAVQVAESLDASVVGMTADPTSREVWERIGPHIEQRLGPIDVVVAIGAAEIRRAVAETLLPDMTARRRGVLVEVGSAGSGTSMPAGVRHRVISIGADDPTGHSGADVTSSDIAAAVLLCASDSLAAMSLTIAQPDT